MRGLHSLVSIFKKQAEPPVSDVWNDFLPAVVMWQRCQLLHSFVSHNAELNPVMLPKSSETSDILMLENNIL